jgi:hypothetical protein
MTLPGYFSGPYSARLNWETFGGHRRDGGMSLFPPTRDTGQGVFLTTLLNIFVRYTYVLIKESFQDCRTFFAVLCESTNLQGANGMRTECFLIALVRAVLEAEWS